MDRGMMVEVGRGQLQVPVGVVLQGQYACDLEEIFTPIIQMMDQFVRLGIVRGKSKGNGQQPDARMELQADH